MESKAALYAEVAQVDVRVALTYMRYFAAPTSARRDDDGDEARIIEALCKLQPYMHALGASTVEQALVTAARKSGSVGDGAVREHADEAFAGALRSLQRRMDHQQQRSATPTRSSSSGGGGGFLRRLFGRDTTRRTSSSKHVSDTAASRSSSSGGGAKEASDSARTHSIDAAHGREHTAAVATHAHDATSSAAGKDEDKRHHDDDDDANDAHDDATATGDARASPPPPQTNYELLAHIQREEAELAHKYNFDHSADATATAATAAVHDGEFSVIFNKFLQGSGKR